MKKILVALMVACMAATCFALPAGAVGNPTTEEELVAALAAAQPGETVTLGGPITLQKAVTVPAGVALDGATYELTANFDSVDTATSAVVYADGNVSNLVVNAAGRVKYAVQAYGAAVSTTLTSVTMKSGKYSGLIVNNGAGASLAGCVFRGNAFSAVELADGADHTGAAPRLTVDDLTDAVTVRTDMAAGAQPSVTVQDNGPVMTVKLVNGQGFFVNNSETMLAAFCNTPGVTNITLAGDVQLTSSLKIAQPIALNGNKHRLILAQDIAGVPQYGNAVTVEADGVQLQNLTVDAAQKAKYAVHVYDAARVLLDGVTMTNGLHNGALVDGSDVTMQNVSFLKNGSGDAGGVEIGKSGGVAGTPKVTLKGTVTSDHPEKVLYVDTAQVPAADVAGVIDNQSSNLVITVNADGTVASVDKQTSQGQQPEEKPQPGTPAPPPAGKPNPQTGVTAQQTK